MRVLVTGASGFIGSHVAESLARGSHHVVATGRDCKALEPLASLGCQTVSADLTSDALSPLVNGCEAIVHCAAMAAPWGDRASFWRHNVLATERLLAAAQKAGSVSRLVHLSSPSIYFSWRDELDRSEEFEPPRRWPTPYAETKWIAECRVREARSLGPIILRPRAVFGPRDRAILPRLAAVARRGRFPLPDAGRAWTDVTAVANVVIAVEAALRSPSSIEGRAFNITNGTPLQVRDLLTRLFAVLGISTRFVSIPRIVGSAAASLIEAYHRRRPGAPEPRVTRYGMGLLGYSQTLSIAAARDLLGYQPRVSIDEGLALYAQWWAAR
jgi:nucleoside-diphosphate-sugar epimerase